MYVSLSVLPPGSNVSNFLGQIGSVRFGSAFAFHLFVGVIYSFFLSVQSSAFALAFSFSFFLHFFSFVLLAACNCLVHICPVPYILIFSRCVFALHTSFVPYSFNQPSHSCEMKCNSLFYFILRVHLIIIFIIIISGGVERIRFRVCSFSFLSIAVSGLLGFIFHLPLRTLTYLFTL